MKRLFKEIVRIRDCFSISGGQKSKARGGIFMADGSPVPVALVAATFGVSEDEAKKIIRERAL